MPKPFIKWAGGKGRLLSQIETYLPEGFDAMQHITYIEPFVGGGAMLFNMLSQHRNIERAVINDISQNLITAYRTIQTQPEILILRLEEIQTEYLALDEIHRKEYFYHMREMLNGQYINDLENTAMFIYLNRTCFNGLYRENSKGEFNVPFGKYSNPTICDGETILSDSELLQRVEILHGDYTQVENYIDGRNTFIYFDPPYRPLNSTSSFNSYVKEPFNDEEQRRLEAFFARMSDEGCMVMLSNSDCSAKNPEDTFFEDLYADFTIERVWASRGINANASKRGKLTELLIHNYKNSVGDNVGIFDGANMVAEPIEMR
jgi:DNA adenine methylase